MKSGSRSNALLVELLIVVMFFMLASTTLLEVYATARNQSAQSGTLTQALNAAQNTADRLYAAQDAEKTLAAMDFVEKDGTWRLSCDGYDLSVTATTEQREAGFLSRYQVQAVQGEKVLVNLPVACYREGQK